MKKLLSTLVIISISFSLFAQTTDAENSVLNSLSSNSSVQNTQTKTVKKLLSDTSVTFGNAQLAMSESDYMVTAGDVYTLTYAAGSGSVTYRIPVDSTYKIRVSNLAVIDVAGKTYLQLKKQIEDIVTRNYPLSGVQFVLTTPATFKITFKGEVTETTEAIAWPLSRLSTFVNQITTEYSSVRDIKITSENGRERTYDLFRASRYGELYNDPYVRPGDVITVNRIKRVVTIQGAVERPGSYELMRDENLKALVDYASGLKETANPERITLRRNRGAESKSWDELYLNKDVLTADFELNNGDVLFIEDYFNYMNSIVVEGAINNVTVVDDGESQYFKSTASSSSDSTVTTPTTSRISIKFYNSENYASFARRIKDVFNSSSDLQKSYVERDGSRIPLNLEEYLNNQGSMSEYVVLPGDKLVILNYSSSQYILLTGEVTTTRYVSAGSGVYLSSLLSGNLTDYSSNRNVQVTGVDGATKTYDLFQSTRFGKMDQDPIINAGETVNVLRAERKVTLSGAVERPGEYQLLPGENLETLINYYGNGLTATADPSRIEITRVKTESSVSGEKLYLTEIKSDSSFDLMSYDSIFISTYSELKPVMFMEGAVGSLASSTALDTSNKVAVQFERGTNYAYFIRSQAGMFKSSVSDNENAYIIRGEEVYPININSVLYDSSFTTDLVVTDRDTLIVPFKQYFVTVAGAVRNPGRYPYIPDRTYEYYVALAGGFVPMQNANDAVSITDSNGKHMSKNDYLKPECRIVAKSNHISYLLTTYGSLIASISTFVTTVVALIQLPKSIGK